MLRVVIVSFLLCCLIACGSNNNQAEEDLPAAQNDTFDFSVGENDNTVPSAFSVDTFSYFDKKSGYSQTIMYPEIKGNEFTALNELLKKEIKRKAGLNNLVTTDNEPADTSKEIFGVTEDNILLKMHKEKRLVSYGFLNLLNAPEQMRPFRTYFSINYDITEKKFIYLNDYFKIVSSADSAFLKSIIFGDMGIPDLSAYIISNAINFSFDRDYVYLYFDMFGATGNPMGLVKRVKKQYLYKFIQDNYK
jgi:hypothetical protein